MRQYIKTFAMTLLVSLGFVACNDNEEFDNFHVNYPSSVPTGYYESAFSLNGDYDYSMFLQKGADDSVTCQMMRTVKDGKEGAGKSVTLFSVKVKDYADSTGIFNVAVPADNNYYEKDVEVGMAIKRDNSTIQTLLSVNGAPVANVAMMPSQNQPTVNGFWLDTQVNVAMELGSDTIHVAEIPSIDNKLLGVFFLNGNGYKFGYEYDGKNGKFIIPTQEEDMIGTFAYDDNYNMVVNFLDTTFVCVRDFSTPAPEVFNPIKNGNMVYGLQDLTGRDFILFDQGMAHPAVLLQSEEKPSRYKIQPWLGNEDGLVFVESEEGVFRPETTPTGYAANEGPIFGGSLLELFGQDIPFEIAEEGIVMPMGYNIPGLGPIAAQIDMFMFSNETAPAEMPKKVISTKRVKAKKALRILDIDVKPITLKLK